MKHRTSLKGKILGVALLLTAIVAIGAFSLQDPAFADSSIGDPGLRIYFGAAGLARGQTVRLNLANLGGPDTREACHARLSFLDSKGIIINWLDGTPAKLDVDVFPTETIFLDLDSRNIIIIGGRTQFRAQVEPAVPRDLKVDPCANLAPTLELFDQATKRTTLLVHPALIRGFNPQPDPPGVPLQLQ
jgi:hypothetical protein